MSATKLIFYLLVVVTINAMSCKTTSTGSVVDPIIENPPGTRNYEWTTDTLYTPSVDLYRLWGAADDDLWAIGKGALLENFLWHFDGKTWSKKQLNNNGWIMPYTIFGFQNNDLWIAGSDGLNCTVWHGDGVTWNTSLSYKSQGDQFNSFMKIWGEAPDDIYAIGLCDSLVDSKDWHYGLIFHFDGKSWQRVDIEKIHSVFLDICKEKGGNGQYYILGHLFNVIDGSYTISIYEFDKVKIKEIYSLKISSNSYSSMKLIDGKIYFSLNTDLCRYKNDKFIKLKTIEGINGGSILGGRNENDMFWGLPGGLGHFNGTDLQIIYNIAKTETIMDIKTFDDKVFILLPQSGGRNLVIKGIMKKGNK